MKFSIVAAAFALPCAMALPAETTSKNNALDARALPKFNQYRTMADCQADRNILFHAAPTLGNCYDIDSQTGAFFYNTGGWLFSSLSTDIGCNGAGEKRIRGGECMEKGPYRSLVMR